MAIEATARHKAQAADIADEGTIGCMGFHVCVECVSVSKSAATYRATVLMCLLMNGQMLFELRSLGKGLRAVLTPMGPLTSVCEDMCLQVRWVHKALATVVTTVGALQPMHLVVGLQCRV